MSLASAHEHRRIRVRRSARTLIGFAFAALVAACGFQPLMSAHDGTVAEDLARVRIYPIADRSGQILRNRLVDDLGTGRGTATLYTLDIRLTEPRQEIAVRRDESASRVAYTAAASFILRDSTGNALFGGSSSSSSTFEATSSEFASIAGQMSARDRALQELSADIRQQLAAFFYRYRRGASAAN